MVSRARLRVAVLLSCALAAMPAPAAGPTDNDVKAAFLYHFASFVEWPPGTFPARTTPLVVGVLGHGPLSEAVERTLQGKTAGDRPLVIRRLTQPDEAAHTQICLVEDSARESLPLVLRAVREASVLTVADMEGFAQRGGIVNFVLQQRKVRFEINLARAQQARLKISSQLLKLATIVPSGD
jgi:hypothetical protein